MLGTRIKSLREREREREITLVLGKRGSFLAPVKRMRGASNNLFFSSKTRDNSKPFNLLADLTASIISILLNIHRPPFLIPLSHERARGKGKRSCCCLSQASTLEASVTITITLHHSSTFYNFTLAVLLRKEWVEERGPRPRTRRRTGSIRDAGDHHQRKLRLAGFRMTSRTEVLTSGSS